MHHTGPIAGVAAFKDLIATAGYDNQVILWNAQSREALARANHDHLVNHCAFSPDGKWLVSASSDYSARLWSVPDLRLRAVLSEHGDDVDMAEFSPDARRIATCALDRCVRVFNLDGRCLQTLRGHTGNVLSLAWMPDNRRLVSSSVDGTLRTWDSITGECERVIDLEVRTDSFAIGNDGCVYAGDDRGRISITSVAPVTAASPGSQADGTQFIPAHRAGIKKIVLDARQDLLVSLGYDRSLKVWRRVGRESHESRAGLRELYRTVLPECVWARGAAVLDDGRIATGTFGSTYAIFDGATSTWDVRGVAPGPALNAVLSHQGHVYSVGDAGIVRKDGIPIAAMGSLCNFLVAASDRVLTGGHAGILFDAATGESLYAHRSPLNCAAAFLRDGQPGLAVGTYTGEIICFRDLGSRGLEIDRELAVFQNAVKSLTCSDGLLFSVCASTDLAWHRIADWSQVKKVAKGHERIANGGCALGQDRFASIGRDRMLRIWGPEAARCVPTPHQNSVKCIGVNAARTALLTGSYGGTLAWFDVAQGEWTRFLRPTSAGISSITWDDAGQQFLAASYDGNIYPVAA